MKTGFILLLGALLVGCGSFPEHRAQIHPADGLWQWSARALTETSAADQPCEDYVGHVSVEYGTLNGGIAGTQSRNMLDVSGQLRASGGIKKALAYSGPRLLEFTGILSPNNGEGMWRDSDDCRGMWMAARRTIRPH